MELEVSPSRSASQPEVGSEVLHKYVLPPPLNSGHVKVSALNWTINKPEGDRIHAGFPELFKSEDGEDDIVKQDVGPKLVVKKEELKPKHEILESLTTVKTDFSTDDLKPDSKDGMCTVGGLQATVEEPPAMVLDVEGSELDTQGTIQEIQDTQSMELGEGLGVDLVDSNLDTKSGIRIVGGIESTNERPHKRKRNILDAVEMPTMSSIVKKRESIDIKNVKREQEHKNVKWTVKVKKDCEFGFSLDTVFRRIDELNIKEYPLDLDEEFLNTTVNREFLSGLFGGNPQQTFPKISAENLKKHGYNDFMYLNLDYNPRAPQRAGFPGLFFQCADSDPEAEWEEGPQRVFIRIASGVWLYVGQYSMVRASPLTVEEWKTQSRSVMTTWSEKVCTQSWGILVRTRIGLRKTLKREPTEEETNSGMSKNFQTTAEEVIQAYNSGQEAIGVWVMKCIGYDEAFQRNIIEKFADWVPKAKPVKTQPKKKKKKH